MAVSRQHQTDRRACATRSLDLQLARLSHLGGQDPSELEGRLSSAFSRAQGRARVEGAERLAKAHRARPHAPRLA